MARSDGELLEGFAERGEAGAFGELVKRHVGWVHGAALRMVRDPGKAMDVTQAVFILLAQKAGKMKRGAPLGPWLFRALGYTVKALRRSEARRRRHEATAGVRGEAAATGASMELAEELDGAVGRLSAADREAIVLRFYEERPLAGVAAAMKTSEEAAKKRVARAVETLRRDLMGRGFRGAALGSFAPVLVEALRGPGGVPEAGTVAAQALGSGGTGSAGFVLAKGASAMVTAAKAKVGAAVLAAAMVVMAGGLAVRSLQGQGSGAAGSAPTVAVLREPLVVATEPAVTVTQQPTHNARLSPDGRYLLYLSPQRVNGEVKEVLLMKNLQTGGFSVVPTDVSGGMDTVLTRFGMFLADGSLVVSQVQAGGVAASGPAGRAPERYELVSVNGETGVVKPLGVSGEGPVFGKSFKEGLVGFTARWEIFTALPPAYDRQVLGIRGMVNAVSPASDALVVLVPPARGARPAGGGAERAPRPTPAFVLYEVGTEKKTELPMHPGNTVLDDVEAEFTADGRYVYYQDFRDGAEGKLVGITRVWDRSAGKTVVELEAMVPLGPGPTAGTMWLAESPGQGKGAVVHDAAAGKMERFLAGRDVQHATGQRVVYLEKAAEGRWVLKVVDVEAGAAGR